MFENRTDMHTAEKIATENLSLGYGKDILVHDLFLKVPKCSFTVMLGANGSGKTTILKSVANLLRPSQGAILLDGAPIARLSAKQVARKLGLLAQEQNAPEGLTVWDLIKQGRYPHRSVFSSWTADDELACEEALELTGMQEFRNRPIDTLSGGQKQRAWISLALSQQTDLLLLDEPTTFLDLAHQVEILELITSLVEERGKTVLAVLHDLNQAARYASNILLLKDGKLFASGIPKQVITPQSIQQTFGIKCRIETDTVTGDPICIPESRRRCIS